MSQRTRKSQDPAAVDGPLALAAADMLLELERQRAQCQVQQLANGHADTDPFTMRGAVSVSYAERFAELEKGERNLRGGLSKATLARAEELAAGQPSVAD